MKPEDGKKSETPPPGKADGGDVVYLRKPAKPNQPLDVAWFYEDEEFFAEHMDEFDW